MKVRKHLSLLLTLLLPLMAAGQQIPDAGQQTPAAGPGTGAPSAADFPHVIPRSPDVAALEKFCYYPVGCNTGTVNVSVPLYHFTLAAGLSLDVSLSCHTSGVRVDDQGGRLGTGWTLNAGGCISREIRGLCDETYSSGFYNFIRQHPGYEVPTDIISHASLLDSIAYNFVDLEPDLFYLSFLGRSYKFFLGNDGEFHTIPYSNLRFVRHPLGNSHGTGAWEVIDEHGNRFVFGSYGNTSACELSVNAHAPEKIYTTAWQLLAVLSPEGEEEATFTYTLMPFAATDLTHSIYKVRNDDLCAYLGASGNLSGHFGLSSTTDRYGFDACGLTVVSVRGTGTVSVTPVPPAEEDGHHRIAALAFHDVTGAAGLSYFFSYAGNGRKYLSAVTRGTSADSAEPYRTFSYYGGTPTPSHGAQDLWGYYNAKNSNLTLFPSDAGIPASENVDTADRSVNGNATAGSLKTVTYPTGGTVTFTYENNEAGGALVGGLRISAVTISDTVGRTVERKTYAYRDAGGQPSGIAAPRPVFKRSYIESVPDNAIVPGFTGVDEYSETSLLRYSGSPVQYRHVTETTITGTDTFTTAYEYAVRPYCAAVLHAGLEYCPASLPFEANDYMEGLLQKKVVCRHEGPDSVRVLQEYYGYLVDEQQDPIHRFRALTSHNMGDARPPGFTDMQWYQCATYDLVSAKVLPLKTISTEFMDDGTPLVTVTETAYGNSNYINPTAVTRYVTADSADVETTAYRYCYDLTTAVADSLTARNMVAVPLQTVHSHRDAVTTTSTGYDFFTGNGRRILEPSLVTVSRGSNARTLTFHDYDRYGNPLHVSLNGSEHRGYLWSYSGRQPVAEILPGTTSVSSIVTAVQGVFGNTPYTLSTRSVPDTVKLRGGALQAALPGALVTTMTHDARGGLTSLTAANGLTTSYAYDAVGRLCRTAIPYLPAGGTLTESVSAAYAYHYRGTDANGSSYVRSRLMRSPDGSAWSDSYSHADGLGRPAVSVAVGAGPQGQDIAAATEYQGAGRTWRQWLPVPLSCGTAMPDSTDITAAAAAFYGSGEKPYSQSEWEASALDRVRTAYGPGRAWHDGGHAVTTGWMANSTMPGLLRCRRYAINGTTLTSTGCWPDAALHVTVTADEDGSLSYTFTDLTGREVLRRTVIADGTAADTYYIYDGYGDLLCVLPPEAAARTDTDSSWDTEDSDVLQDYAYLYRYDSRGRCTWKKLPGAEPVICTYDAMDRLTASQDGNQRSQGLWQHQTYDVFGRPVATTLGTQPLRTCYYDGYAFLASEGSDSQTHLQYAAMSAYGTRYTDTRGLLTGERVYTLGDTEQEYTVRAHYYDERGRIVQSRTTNHLGGYDSDYYKYSFTGQTVKHRHEHSAPGQPNVTEVTDYTYDHADRLLTATHTLNGGTPVTLASNQYDAIGRLGSTVLMGASALTTAYGYNVRSWPKTVSSPLFSQTLYYEDGTRPRWGGSIASQEWDADGTVRRYDYAYDSLSRLLRADYSEAGGLHAGRYSTRYAYDRQGNLTEIVRHGLRGTETTFVSEPILLGQEEQQTAGATASPAGLAGGQAGTATPVYGVLDSLTLTYRGNRLLAVENRAPRPTVLMSPRYSFVDGAHGSVEYAYDANGNMTQDMNKGLSAVSYNTVNLPERYVFAAGDTTSCTYNAAGEKLRVSYSTQTLRPIDFALGGSVISPQGGGMTPGDPVILPACVTTTYDYCGNLVYQDGVLKYLLVDGGFVTFTKTGTGANATYTPTYHAYLRDHLGSNRVVASSTGTAEQVYHYYPYGSMFNGGNMLGTATTPSQPYLYCGKELDTMHGLSWYDSKARTYDPVLGILPQMDPLAEKYHPWSPYVYCMGNPVRYVDPDGRKIRFAEGVSEKFKMNFASAVKYLRDNKVDGLMAKLEARSEIVYITETTSESSKFTRNNMTISWNPSVGLYTTEGHELSPTTILNHEVDHALSYLEDPEAYEKRVNENDDCYQNKEEKRAITGNEQKTAKALGEIEDGEVTRTNHTGSAYSTQSPTTTKAGSTDKYGFILKEIIKIAKRRN